MLLNGKELGHYSLESLLGSGGMGDVYVAHDTRINLNRQVAVKVIKVEGHTSTQASKEAVRLYEREVQAIAFLDHPHILPLYDFGQELIDGNTILYLVMPYRVEGSLMAWLSKKQQSNHPLLPQEVAKIVQQAASALQHAHDKDIIHQDVKPANFLIRGETTPPDLLLSDFGIARIGNATSSNISQAVRGTPLYMAPEQWEGQPVRATDQYALAVMTYEMLTGHPLFQGSPPNMMYHHINEMPLPPSQVNPALSSSIDLVLMRALAKEPYERFERIELFAQELINASPTDRLHNLPEVIEEASLGEENSITDLSLWNLPAAMEPTALQQKETPPTVQLESADQPTLHIHITPKTSLPSVNAPYIDYKSAASSQTRFMPHLFALLYHKVAHIPKRVQTIVAPTPTVIKRIAAGTPLSIYNGHSSEVRSIAWSPDGNYVATAGNDETVQIWNPSNARRVSLCSGHSASVYAVHWASESSYLATASADKTVMLWTSGAGRRAFTYRAHTGAVYATAWSPDGQRLVSAGADRIVRLWDAQTHKDLVLYKAHEDWIRAITWSPDGRYVATASNDHTAHVWNATNGQLVVIYHGHTDWVRSITWSPDGAFIATASNDQTVHIWNATNGHQFFVYRGHSTRWPGGVLCVSWSPDGKYLASSGEDLTVQIWNPGTGNEVLTYRRHSAPVNAIAWSPDSRIVATASNDKTAHTWSYSDQ